MDTRHTQMDQPDIPFLFKEVPFRSFLFIQVILSHRDIL